MARTLLRDEGMDQVLERIAAWEAAGLIDAATSERLRAAEAAQSSHETGDMRAARRGGSGPQRALVSRFDLRPGHRDRRDVRLPRRRVPTRGIRDVRLSRRGFSRPRLAHDHGRHDGRGVGPDPVWGRAADRRCPPATRRRRRVRPGRLACRRRRGRRCRGRRLRMACDRRRCRRGCHARSVRLSPAPSVAAHPGGAPREPHELRWCDAELARIRRRSAAGLQRRARPGPCCWRTGSDPPRARLRGLVARPRGHRRPGRPGRGEDGRCGRRRRSSGVTYAALGRARCRHRAGYLGLSFRPQGRRRVSGDSSSRGSATWRSSSSRSFSSSARSGATRARSSTRPPSG